MLVTFSEKTCYIHFIIGLNCSYLWTLDVNSCINVLLSAFVVAGVLGFGIGKMSYIGECQKKFQKSGYGSKKKRFVFI